MVYDYVISVLYPQIINGLDSMYRVAVGQHNIHGMKNASA